MRAGFGDYAVDTHEILDADHGRIERSRYWTVADIDWLTHRTQWSGLKSIGMVESRR